MRPLAAIWLGLIAAGTPAAANAHDFDSEHLFGFTSGTDLGDPGEVELEFESEGSFGKRAGTYRALTGMVELKYTSIQDFRIAGIAGGSGHRIMGVPGLDDRNSAGFDSLAFDLRKRLLDRDTSGIGVAVSGEPFWSRRDEKSGEPVEAYGAQFLLMVDKELVKDKVLAAFNLLYVPQTSRSLVTGMRERDSTLAASAAISGRIAPGVFLGGEVRYLRAYEGLGLNSLAGQAFFVGPTLYVKVGSRLFVSLGWSVQVAGRATGIAGPLDLENFARHQTVFRIGASF